jgi:hypothetical protein
MAHASCRFCPRPTRARRLRLIDESDGRVRAHREIAWLQENKATGRLTLWSTPQVLKQASGQTGWIKHGLTWQAVYGQMRQFDDGLPDLKARPT